MRSDTTYRGDHCGYFDAYIEVYEKNIEAGAQNSISVSIAYVH